LLGYRQCGERAVRVDILERLADSHSSPHCHGAKASPGEKPAGAFDGRGFVVTQAMTSLTGSAGEDFASILRALGYHMERRPAPPPKPAPVVVETAAAEQTPAEPASETPSEAAMEAAPTIADAVPAQTPVAVDSGDVADISNDIPKIFRRCSVSAIVGHCCPTSHSSLLTPSRNRRLRWQQKQRKRRRISLLLKQRQRLSQLAILLQRTRTPPRASRCRSRRRAGNGGGLATRWPLGGAPAAS